MVTPGTALTVSVSMRPVPEARGSSTSTANTPGGHFMMCTLVHYARKVKRQKVSHLKKKEKGGKGEFGVENEELVADNWGLTVGSAQRGASRDQMSRWLQAAGREEHWRSQWHPGK
jgi:hypothetical protein